MNDSIVSSSDQNPNDVNLQHNYALHVLFGAVHRILSIYVNNYKDKAPRPQDVEEVLQTLKAYHRTAEQLEISEFAPTLMKKTEALIEELQGEKFKRDPRTSKELDNGKTHVDDWLNEVYTDDPDDVRYAKFFLELRRKPAISQNYYRKIMEQHKLFVTHEGKRWRCTGASRMGDIWLASDFDRTSGYDKRVYVDDCTDWGPQP